MITQIDVTAPSGDVLNLNMTDWSNGFSIQDVDGLGPVKATITSSSFAKIDGTQYQSSRRESRNILLKIGLEANYTTTTVRSLRETLYNYFMPNREVTLRFHVDNDLEVIISGRVESCVPDIFSKDPVVDISIICFDPDFVEETAESFSGSSVDTDTVIPFTYNGTVDTGMVFTINIDRSVSSFTIYHTPPDGTIRSLDFAMSLSAGDVVEIRTVRGDKFVGNTREDVTYSVLYAMSPQSNWIEFSRGDNTFRVYAAGAALSYTVSYFNRYGGL
jgi:hypothetical protein